MTSVHDLIDKARANAQDLHKRVMSATGRDDAAVKNDFQKLAVDAQQLAATLKAAAQGESADALAKRYLDDAVAQLEDAAIHAKNAAESAKPEFDKSRAAVVAEITGSIQGVSHALAAKRSALHTSPK